MEVILAIISGAVGAAIVSGIFGIVMWKLNRRAAKEDKKDSEKDEIQKTLDNLTVAMRVEMYDRIKRHGNAYIRRGDITSEELEDLISMHQVYHDILKGNGFLDSLMEKVKALPVKN